MRDARARRGSRRWAAAACLAGTLLGARAGAQDGAGAAGIPSAMEPAPASLPSAPPSLRPIPVAHEAGELRLWEFPAVSDRFSLVVLVEAGSIDEEKGATGLAHLVEHAIFRGGSSGGSARGRAGGHGARGRDDDGHGDEARGGGDVIARLAAMNCTFNGATYHDATTYHFDVPAEHAAELVAFVGDLVVRPAFRDEDVRLESAIVLEELNAGATDLPRHVLLGELYGDHPLGRDIGGSPRHVARLGAAEVRAFHAKHYRAGGVVVAWAGPEEAAIDGASVAAAFAGLRAGRHERDLAPPRPRLRKWITGRERAAKAGNLVVGRHVVPDDPEALVAMLVFRQLLEEAAFRRMRQDTGLTYAPLVRIVASTLAWHVELHASTADAARLRALADAATLAFGDARSASDEDVASTADRLASQLAVRDAAALEAQVRTAWQLSEAGAGRDVDVRASLLSMTGATYRHHAAARLGETAGYRVADDPSLSEAPPGLASAFAGLAAAAVICLIVRGWWRRRAIRRELDREIDRVFQFRR